MNRIKLLYLIDQLNIGGTEKQLLAVIERLDRSKFDPYLVCLRATCYLDKCNIDCHIKVLEVGSLASLSGLFKLISFAKFMKKEEIEIIHTFFFDSTVFGVLAGRLARVRRILSSRRDMGFWYTPTLLTVLFFVNLLTHRIVVNSEAIKNNVHSRERVGLNKIDVIYNGVDLQSFTDDYDVDKLRNKLGIPENDLIFGIIANLNRRVKRVDLYVDAAAQVMKKQENVSFVVVGEGCFREELEAQADNLNIAGKIHFVGTQINVVPYLQLFDVGVLTSESEGFSNSIIEYMAAGLPVVCFDAGGNAELIENNVNGFAVRNQCSLDLSKKMAEFSSDKEKPAGLISFNERILNSLYWENKIKEIHGYYLHIV